MKEVQDTILKEKLKKDPDKRFIQWLQKLNHEILKDIIIKNYKK